MIKNLILILTISTLLFSCSKKEEANNAEVSYIKAMKKLKDKSYSEAGDDFEKIDSDFPFSKWAIKGQTMAVYARYKDENYVKLLSTIDDFLRLNPNNEYVPYMLYMKGLSYYNQIPEITRAQDTTQQASFIFRELIARFPNSDYAPDAKEKLVVIDEHMAGAKMSVGRYQIKTINYVGALENFRDVTVRYQYTNQAPEAYLRLVEIYYKVGFREEARKAFFQIKSKYPDNDWTKLAEKLYAEFD